ncbi:response regulator transcription factor [Limibacter armeniacum]|uniref:LytR/AlgR family response regulator transcription factor n=1 Tax=Limibacter armeniacum TaxID=466084 RepID=UPI002FE58BE8
METVRIAILEDNLVMAKNLTFTLEELGYEVVGEFRKGEDLLEKIADLDVDLLLLDVELPGTVDGIQTAAVLRKVYKGPIIYLTSRKDEDTFSRAKPTLPAAYLQKPFDKNTLRSSIELAAYHAQQEGSETSESSLGEVEELDVKDAIFVKSKNRLMKVIVGDILYIQANDIYATVVTAEGQYLVNYSLKHLEQQLPSLPFYRTHRSFIVNLDRVSGLEDGHLLIGDNTIPVGKTYREELMKHFRVL